LAAALPRRADPRFLRGEARFIDDVVLPGQLHAAFLRSPHAHARIVRVSTTAARGGAGGGGGGSVDVRRSRGGDESAAAVRRGAAGAGGGRAFRRPTGPTVRAVPGPRALRRGGRGHGGGRQRRAGGGRARTDRGRVG